MADIDEDKIALAIAAHEAYLRAQKIYYDAGTTLEHYVLNLTEPERNEYFLRTQ